MDTKFVKVLFDLECDWEAFEPEYRVYVNDELFAERTYRWKDPYYLTEMLQVEGEPGLYDIKLEILGPQHSEFKVSNTRIAYGPGNIVNDLQFEIQ